MNPPLDKKQSSAREKSKCRLNTVRNFKFPVSTGNLISQPKVMPRKQNENYSGGGGEIENETESITKPSY